MRCGTAVLRHRQLNVHRQRYSRCSFASDTSVNPLPSPQLKNCLRQVAVTRTKYPPTRLDDRHLLLTRIRKVACSWAFLSNTAVTRQSTQARDSPHQIKNNAQVWSMDFIVSPLALVHQAYNSDTALQINVTILCSVADLSYGTDRCCLSPLFCMFSFRSSPTRM